MISILLIGLSFQGFVLGPSTGTAQVGLVYGQTPAKVAARRLSPFSILWKLIRSV